MHVNPFHRARIERGLTIEQIVEASKLPAASVAKIDEGRFEELPGGIYARSHIRTVASVLGLDPADALAAVEPRLPALADPLEFMRECARPKTGASWPNWTLPEWAGLRSGWERLRAASRRAGPLIALPALTARVSIAGIGARAGALTMGKRAMCAVLDGLILCAISASALGLAAAICGQSPRLLAARAPAAVSLFFLLTSACYFVLIAGIAGRTLGERACAVSARSAGAPLSAGDILARAASAWWDESSVLLNLLFTSWRVARRRGATGSEPDLTPGCLNTSA